MANSLITPQMITAETLDVLHNKSAFLKNINTEYNDQFAKTGAKAGATVNVRRPVQFTVRSGATVNLQDVNETQVPITIDPEFGIDWTFSDYDLTLSIDKFRDRYLEPAGMRLATELDMRIAALYKKVSNFAGTPGTPVSSISTMLDANALLDENACEQGRRMAGVTQRVAPKLINDMKGLFQSGKIGKQNDSGVLESVFGFNLQMSQNMPTHTVGPTGGTPLVNGANQGLINSGATDNPYASTTTLVSDGWTAAAALRLRAGDVIEIAGVNAVNPDNKQDLGRRQQFVVVSDASSDASGNASIVISPAIIAGGAYQNVTARPADNAGIFLSTGTPGATYSQNMIYHRDAFTMVTVDMELPDGVDMKARSNFGGVSLRFIRSYDITNNRRICRFDILAGFAALRPEWAVRVTN